ncbi:MAG: hypothetical protein GDA52_02305 [Rhodobacteraceae bacterium]|nr:hypothetical protein [Paracoccaceae bacterium]
MTDIYCDKDTHDIDTLRAAGVNVERLVWLACDVECNTMAGILEFGAGFLLERARGGTLDRVQLLEITAETGNCDLCADAYRTGYPALAVPATITANTAKSGDQLPNRR